MVLTVWPKANPSAAPRMTTQRRETINRVRNRPWDVLAMSKGYTNEGPWSIDCVLNGDTGILCRKGVYMVMRSIDAGFWFKYIFI
jgi:hypothetical protein